MVSYNLSHLKELESEAIFVIREVAAQFERPVLMFSGGKDSITMLHLARKAFFPAKLPFPLLHVDTGHNFPETIAFRDKLMKEIGAKLIVGSVQDSIDAGTAVEETGINASRIRLQTTTLLESLEKYQFDAALGGARRDEEKARAKDITLDDNEISAPKRTRTTNEHNPANRSRTTILYLSMNSQRSRFSPQTTRCLNAS